MASQTKRYLLVVVLFVLIVGSQVACDDNTNKTSSVPSPAPTSAPTSDWLKCVSLVCKYRNNDGGDVKTTTNPARIHVGAATPVSGNWVAD